MSLIRDRRASLPCQPQLDAAAAAAPVVVTIAASMSGRWLVESSDGSIGGTFACPKAALRFVRDEAAGVMVAADGILDRAGRPGSARAGFAAGA